MLGAGSFIILKFSILCHCPKDRSKFDLQKQSTFHLQKAMLLQFFKTFQKILFEKKENKSHKGTVVCQKLAS